MGYITLFGTSHNFLLRRRFSRAWERERDREIEMAETARRQGGGRPLPPPPRGVNQQPPRPKTEPVDREKVCYIRFTSSYPWRILKLFSRVWSLFKLIELTDSTISNCRHVPCFFVCSPRYVFSPSLFL